jgi:hypothetical protein
MTHEEEIATLKARVRELEALLNQSHRSIESVFRLPPALSKLMGLLLAMPQVTEKNICEQLDIATVGKVAIWRLRQVLQPHGIEIKSKRTVGWWFDDETKDRIRKILDGEVTLEVTETTAAA